MLADTPLPEHAAPAPVSRPRGRLRPAGLLALLAWIVPGSGQLLLGEWRKALAMAFGIYGLYAVGLWLTGFTAVDPQGRTLHFAAQVWGGGPTALTWWLTKGVTQTTFLPYLDVGQLYVAVASLLNVVAITDAVHGAHLHNRTILARRAEAAARARAAATAAAAAAAGPVSLDEATQLTTEPANEDEDEDEVVPAEPTSSIHLEGGVREPESPLLGVVTPKLERSLDLPESPDTEATEPGSTESGERS